MNLNYDLPRIVDEAFAPVSDAYGLKRVADDRPEWGEVVVLQNGTTALRVYTETGDQDVTIQVFRLGPERLPPVRWGIDERAADPDNGFDVLDLVALRHRDDPLLQDQTRGLDQQRLTRVLRGYAEFLNAHGRDVLAGDFTVFRELSRAVEERRRAQRGGPRSSP